MSQTLKSAHPGRVDTGTAARQYSEAKHLNGHHTAPPRTAHDEYGRPVSHHTINWLLSPEGASHYGVRSVIAHESNHRPFVNVGASGMRGGYDTMGVGRNFMPTNLHSRVGDGDYNRGRFQRVHKTCNGATLEGKPNRGSWESTPASKWDRSHDAVTNHQYRG